MLFQNFETFIYRPRLYNLQKDRICALPMVKLFALVFHYNKGDSIQFHVFKCTHIYSSLLKIAKSKNQNMETIQ